VRQDSRAREAGQAAPLLLAGVLAVLLGVVVLAVFARAIQARGEHQTAADLAALAGARAMHTAYPRLFEPGFEAGVRNPNHLERGAYLALAREAAVQTARANGAHAVAVSFPRADAIAPVRIRVAVDDAVRVAVGRARAALASEDVAEAELVPPSMLPVDSLGEGEYTGPFAFRQGKPMRPDVALAFDRMYAAARADGIDLVIASAFRSDEEQARLFAAHPDPKWVAPPGHSLHRLGTELDIGPAGAYGWLAQHASEFHFVKRYSWEPWHFGYALNAGSRTPLVLEKRGDGQRGGVPSFVPAAYAGALSAAAQRWNVSAALLGAQLYAESGFNPFAVSPAGARGIAQFMPGTARQYGLANPFDAGSSIDAQAHLMRDLLREFGSVPLALAAYNAGSRRVHDCGCVPAIPETLAYVAKILGIMGGLGDPGALGGSTGLEVRLVA
jgi:Transglycosylase SLT domain/D-alanyl-D-alanine carboxypeptidase/Putative Flp pilus-assembly TadE/G-like